WDVSDPLGDIFLATFGDFPAKEETGWEYYSLAEKNLAGKRIILNTGQPVPSDAYKSLTPSELTRYMLVEDFFHNFHIMGIFVFYVGDAQNFDDIVNFWNLRASDIELLFFDPAHTGRLAPLRDAYLKALRNQFQNNPSRRNQAAIWAKSHESDLDL